jgi:hypothetical protein
MAQQNPFGTSGAGSNAFREAYDRLKAEADARKQGIGQDYASAYQQLREQGYGMGLGASAQKGLSGGQAQGVAQKVSAQQMGQLGNLMQGQERALEQARVGEKAIYSNALLEGQQAQEYSQRQQQTAAERQILINNVINKKGDFTGYTKEQQIGMLVSLGFNRAQAEQAIKGGAIAEAQQEAAYQSRGGGTTGGFGGGGFLPFI